MKDLLYVDDKIHDQDLLYDERKMKDLLCGERKMKDSLYDERFIVR
jgi:hypothetical protein